MPTKKRPTKKRPAEPTPAGYDPAEVSHYVRETLCLSLAAQFADMAGDLEPGGRAATDEALRALQARLSTTAECVRRTLDLLGAIDRPARRR